MAETFIIVFIIRMWIEIKDATKKRFFIKPFGYNDWSYNQFSFNANVFKFIVNRVVDWFKFRLKFPQKGTREIFESVNTGYYIKSDKT